MAHLLALLVVGIALLEFRAVTLARADNKEDECRHRIVQARPPVARRSRAPPRMSHPSATHLLGKFGSLLISRICCLCRAASLGLSRIHGQQSITAP